MLNTLFRFIIVVLLGAGLIFINTAGSISNSDFWEWITQKSEEEVQEGNSSEEVQSTEMVTEVVPMETSMAVPETKSEQVTMVEAKEQEGLPQVTPVPQEVQVPKCTEGKKLVELLSESAVTAGPGYREWINNEEISVFAEPVKNCVGFYATAYFNLWGHNVQNVTYSTKKLKEQGDYLTFDVGLATGSTDNVDIYVYTDNVETPIYAFNMQAGDPPSSLVVDLRETQTLKIECVNHSSYENQIVCYNLKIKEES